MSPVPSSPVALLDQLDAAREAARDGGWPGVERMRLIDEAEPKLTAAVRAVLAVCAEIEQEQADAAALTFHGIGQLSAISKIRAALSVTP